MQRRFLFLFNLLTFSFIVILVSAWSISEIISVAIDLLDKVW